MLQNVSPESEVLPCIKHIDQYVFLIHGWSLSSCDRDRLTTCPCLKHEYCCSRGLPLDTFFKKLAHCICCFQGGDVRAYSTCKEKLLHVIQESGVLSWSRERWQIVEGQN